MKLVRYGNPGKEKPGLIDAAGKLRDLSKVITDVTPDQLSDIVFYLAYSLQMLACEGLPSAAPISLTVASS